jgi:hypothetical protein
MSLHPRERAYSEPDRLFRAADYRQRPHGVCVCGHRCRLGRPADPGTPRELCAPNPAAAHCALSHPPARGVKRVIRIGQLPDRRSQRWVRSTAATGRGAEAQRRPDVRLRDTQACLAPRCNPPRDAIGLQRRSCDRAKVAEAVYSEITRSSRWLWSAFA